MSYLCEICGTVFEEPFVQDRRDILGGFPFRDKVSLCPICATPYYHKVEECTCGGVRSVGEKLCRGCRRGLLKRVVDFFDGLTAEEEEQFDDWMDGESITNRKRWR